MPAKAGIRKFVAQEPELRPRTDKSARFTHTKNPIRAQMQTSSSLKAAPAMCARLQEGKHERLSGIASIRRRDYLAIGLTFGVGLIGRSMAMYLFNTGVVRRVHRARENVRRLGQNAPLPDASATTPDALGALEREIEELHDKLGSASYRGEPLK